MTIYGVILAILFLGAFRELLASIESGNVLRILMSLTLALLVFNDAIYTSWTVEQRKREYRPPLMSIDLANFLILAAVLISMNPTRDNVFSLAVPRIGGWLPESRAWLLLGFYWLLVILWTKLAGVYETPQYPRWLIYCSLGISVLFFIESGFAASSGGKAKLMFTWLTAFYAFFYILALRPFALRKVSFST